MRTTKNGLTGAERVYRFVAQAIPPILACGYVSRLAAFGLAGIFLVTLVVAALSASAQYHRR